MGCRTPCTGVPSLNLDLTRLAERLTVAAKRSADLKVKVSSTDLILSKGGFGTGRSESMPFAALFLRNEDVLGMALDRLEAGKPGQALG